MARPSRRPRPKAVVGSRTMRTPRSLAAFEFVRALIRETGGDYLDTMAACGEREGKVRQLLACGRVVGVEKAVDEKDSHGLFAKKGFRRGRGRLSRREGACASRGVYRASPDA